MPVIKDSRGEDWDIVYNPRLNVFTLSPLGASSRKSQTFAPKPDVVEESPELDEYQRGYQSGIAAAERRAEELRQNTEPTNEHNTAKPQASPKAPTGERWRADKGKKYYIVGSELEVFGKQEKGHYIDNKWFSIGNYFATKAQALDAAEAIESVLAEIHNGSPRATGGLR